MADEMNTGKNGEQDRIAALQQRIIQLKRESTDIRFSAYLDKLWNDVKVTENTVGQLERLLEQNYLLYQRGKAQPAPQPMPRPVSCEQPAPQPASYAQPVSYVQQVENKPQKSIEFQIGTVIFGIVGIAFLLVAFVTFGLNYLNHVFQGIFLYILCALILAFSELFLVKRLEKFSYFLTGLGISGLYITTILDCMYLKVFPGWAALLITALITAFFFYLSRKKDSGLIRIICLIGCYISLMPIHDFQNAVGFLIPAILIFGVNLAGVFCPIKKKHLATDVVQYICSSIVIFYLSFLVQDIPSCVWISYILVCSQVLTLHLWYYRSKEEAGNIALYYVIHTVSLGYMLLISGWEKWLHLAVLGTIVLYLFLMVLLWKKKLRFAPYMYLAIYCVLVYMISGERFWTTLFALIVFAVNRGCSRYFKEFSVPDAVYTMVAALGVCCLTRTGETRLLSYIFAATILLSCIFAEKYKKYHIFTALSFGWLFLITEGFEPFLCSILICALAAVTIGSGFYIKDKSVRIYGLVMMIFVALKLAIYDFYASPAGLKVVVFLVVGVFILGISFLYIYLEKKLDTMQKERESLGNSDVQN